MDISLLKSLIPEELFSQLQEALKDEEKLALFDKKSGVYIPKAKFDEERSKIKPLNDEIANLKAQITDLEAKAKDADSLQASIDKLSGDLTARDSTINAMKREYHVKSELLKSKPRDIEVVMKLLDLDKVTEKDGKYEGLDEQLKELETSKSYLFEPKQTVPTRGGFLGSTGKNEPHEPNDNSDINSSIRLAAGR